MSDKHNGPSRGRCAYCWPLGATRIFRDMGTPFFGRSGALIVVAALLFAPACGGTGRVTDRTLNSADSTGTPANSSVAGATVPPPANAPTATSPADSTGAIPFAPPALNLALVTPAAGSSTRTMILDAVRQHLKLNTRFKVDHIRMAGRWAFVRGTEVVELDKGELQETDLTVSALLEQPVETPTRFRVVEIWTLPDDQTHPFAEFIRKVRDHVQRERLPAGLLPDDL